MQWPHAPVHRFEGAEFFIVTGATLHKQHLLTDAEDLQYLQDDLFLLAQKYGWELQAWALFSNHYHFVARALGDPSNLGRFIQHLHGNSARALNKRENQVGRQVWFQGWDTRLNFEKSYLARLKYVHHNPVKHGLVSDARDYQFCSAAWFEQNATLSFQATLENFNIDQVNVPDDF